MLNLMDIDENPADEDYGDHYEGVDDVDDYVDDDDDGLS